MSKKRKARTQAELADALGISRARVSQYTRDVRWPFGSRGDFDIAKVRAWRRTLHSNSSGPTATGSAPDRERATTAGGLDLAIRAIRVRRFQAAEALDKEKLRHLELARAELEGQLMRVSQVNAAWDLIAAMWRRTCEAIEHQYGPEAKSIFDEGLESATRAISNLTGPAQ